MIRRYLSFLCLLSIIFSTQCEGGRTSKFLKSLKTSADPVVHHKITVSQKFPVRQTFLRSVGMRMYSTNKQVYQSRALFIEGLSYDVGSKPLLRDVNLSIAKGDRITIVGENGVGKSTFLRILAGEISNYSGVVRLPNSIGYLPQSFEVFDKRLVLDHIIRTSSNASWIAHYNAYMDSSYSDWVQEFNALGGHVIFRSIAQLGLDPSILDRELFALSGGEKTKMHLCALMHKRSDLLLLDEPTNHLDQQGIRWLENHLRAFDGAVVMITHDRTLINNTSTGISELSPVTHTFQHFTGGYDAYLVEQAKYRERLIQQRKAQENELENISTRLNRNKNIPISSGSRSDGDKLSFNARGERKQKGLGRQVKSLQTKHTKLEDSLIDVPEGRKEIQIDFSGKVNTDIALSARNLSYSFTNRQLFSGVGLSVKNGDKLCITGPNGSGKTTLLKILAGLLEPETGTVLFNGKVKLGFLDQEQEFVDLNLTPMEFITKMANQIDEPSTYKMLKNFGVSHQHDMHLPLEKLSIGIRRKVQLAGIVASNANLLILDEPTNHLDIMSLEQIEEQLKIFPGIVIAVSHDRYFMNKLSAQEIKIGSKSRKRGEKSHD